MELRQLAHFLAVAEARHFTRAATRVHVTQSSLSSSIRSLERELGSDLFVRSTRRVELTEAGRALLPAARRSVAAAEEGRDAVAGVRGLVRGQLAIGAIATVGPVNLPALLARYHRRHPAVAIRMHHAGVASLPRSETSTWSCGSATSVTSGRCRRLSRRGSSALAGSTSWWQTPASPATARCWRWIPWRSGVCWRSMSGVFHTVRAALPSVIERQGYILVVSSLAAIAPVPGLAAY